MKVKAQLKVIYKWVEVDVPDSAEADEVANAVVLSGASQAEYEGAIIDFDDENMESIAIMLDGDEVGDGC